MGLWDLGVGATKKGTGGKNSREGKGENGSKKVFKGQSYRGLGPQYWAHKEGGTQGHLVILGGGGERRGHQLKRGNSNQENKRWGGEQQKKGGRS